MTLEDITVKKNVNNSSGHGQSRTSGPTPPKMGTSVYWKGRLASASLFPAIFYYINVIKHIIVERGYFYINTVNTFIEKYTSQHQEQENEDIREINTSIM